MDIQTKSKHSKELKEQLHSYSNKNILVLSGGGIRGLAHIGVLKVLEKKGIMKNIKTIAGTSAGAMIGAFHVIGYTAEELLEFNYLLDFKIFRGVTFDNFLSDFGIDDGKKFTYIFDKMFENKGINKNITFLELFQKTNIKLIMTGVCVNDKKVYYISHETYPNMPVVTGLRITTSIPLWFVPVKYDDKLFIDGGMMDNYPIGLFNDNLDSVIGVYLNEERKNISEINNFELYLINALECLFEGMNNACINNYIKQTLNLILPSFSMIDEISLEEKKAMYVAGYTGCMNYLDRIAIS